MSSPDKPMSNSVERVEYSTLSSNIRSSKLTSPTTAAFIVKGAHDWFQDILSSSRNVQQWSSDELDRKLHHLSHWTFLDEQGWRAFVNKTISKLDPPMFANRNFTYFELGIGVGAFSRRLLLQYPYALGVGVDIVSATVEIARTILPADRMKLYTVSSSEYAMIANSTFDHIIAPGVICYFPSLASVENLMREFSRIAKAGASMCLTMIPFDTSGKISCNIVIPPAFWSGNSITSLGLRVTSLRNMSEWNLSHSYNRYAIYLRKENII